MKTWKLQLSLAWAILAWLTCSAAWAVERGVLPMASDMSKLAKESRERRAPILILFSSAGCHYCAQVREEFLVPTTRNADYDNKVIMVEIDAGSSMRMIDFDGKPTTYGDFASRYRINFTPTVKLLDDRGREVAQPIIGIVSRDYYGGFLDQAIDAGLAKIRGNATTAANP